MKAWLLSIFFRKEVAELNRLYFDMKSKEPDEWQKGFMCGLTHALLELTKHE